MLQFLTYRLAVPQRDQQPVAPQGRKAPYSVVIVVSSLQSRIRGARVNSPSTLQVSLPQMNLGRRYVQGL
jgi:hypothetical protein